MTPRTLARKRPSLWFIALGATSCIAPGAKVESQEAAPATAAAATVVPPQPGASLEPLFDELDQPNDALWTISDNYANGPIFHCGWRKDNVIFEGGKLALRVDNAGCPQQCSGKPYASGELQSKKKYGYGRYEARMKPAKLNGSMSGSIFTYNDKPQDEIDIEFIGKDPTIFQSNYFTNGVGQHGSDIQLGFDATESFHDYAFEWRPSSITWFVDGKPVHREDGSRGPLPQAAGAFVVNVWPGNTVDNWLGKLQYEKPVQAEYEWLRFTPLSELSGESAAALSIPKPAGLVPTFWPYAVLSVDLMPPSKPTDLHGFKAIELWVKGDGHQYRLQISKNAVVGVCSQAAEAFGTWRGSAK